VHSAFVAKNKDVFAKINSELLRGIDKVAVAFLL
jgi:hypothetical protein